MMQKVFRAGCMCGGTAGCSGHEYDDGLLDLHGASVDYLLREIVTLLGKILFELRKEGKG